ncbi:MAG: hypothetical protein WCY70_01780 [Methanoculleus sp.]
MKVDFTFKAFAAIFSVIVVLFLLSAFTETVLPGNSYTIEITGLPDLAANGTAMVMVPIPANVTGEPVIPEGAFSGARVAGWQAAVRETRYGKMLAFTATEGYAPDISISFDVLQTEDESQRLPRYQRPINLTAWEMKREPRLLMPALATPDNVSTAEFIRVSNGTYTTVVFFDGFAPLEDAAGITFRLEYRGVGGTKRLMSENTWTTTVNTAVQGTESGFVPVPAEYRVIAGGIGFR